MRLTSQLIAQSIWLLLGVNAASSSQWRSRSVYQVLTDRFARPDESTNASCETIESRYCGGTWNGIVKKLDYIQGMGFDAIWISPITRNIEGNTAHGEAYHGYWQQDIASLNPHFGTPDDLKTLSQALHSRGMVCRPASSDAACVTSSAHVSVSILWSTLSSITTLGLVRPSRSTTPALLLSTSQATTTYRIVR